MDDRTAPARTVAPGRRRFRRTAAAVAACGVLAVALSGCVGAVVGAGATVGTAAMEERGVKGAAKDTAIRADINGLWSDKDERMWRKVGLQVYGGRVLLTGTVDTPQMRDEAVRLAWQADGVREVINEIQLADSGVSDFTRDTWISTQLKSKLLFDSKVASINYSVETALGVIYLIGIAQSQDELDRVTNHARSIEYVRKVVSYVKIKPQDS
jgi:osmotically-inducible protein OsmY